jgi:DNA repair protein RadC
MSYHWGNFSHRGKKTVVRLYGCRKFFNQQESDMEINALSDQELLALLIGEKTAMKLYCGSLYPLAFGAEDKVPNRKLRASVEFAKRLMREKLERGPALQSPRDVTQYLSAHFVGKEYEAFVVVFLDTRHRVLSIEEMFRGTIDGATVYPREVACAVLRHRAAACIFAHNHPSGVAEPSLADQAITRRLKDALSVIDIRVLDHFVIAGTEIVSFAERGLL